MADTLQKFKEIVQVLDKNVPSTREVAETIAKVIKAVQEARAYLEKKTEENKEEISSQVENSINRLDRSLRYVESSMEGKLENIKRKLKEESDHKLDSFAREVYQEIRALEGLIPTPTDLSQVFSEFENMKKQISAIPSIEEIRNNLESLEGDERIDKKAIRGLDDELNEIRKTGVKILGGARGIQLYVDGTKKGQAAMLNLIAGTNVTLIHSTAHGRNDIIIDASGSGSFSVLTATGTIDDSNTSFTFASTPTLVVVNGQSLRDGHGVTITGTSVTLDNPVGTGGDIYALG